MPSPVDRQVILALRELYRRIPKVNCKRLCGHSCRTVIDMSHTERERIETFLGEPLPEWMRTTVNLVCPLLSHTGECTVYGLRPMVCRLWGAVDTPALSCPHGCAVEGDLLTAVEAELLVLEAFRVGGSDIDAKALAKLSETLANAEGMGPLLDRFLADDHSPEVLNAITTKFRAGEMDTERHTD